MKNREVKKILKQDAEKIRVGDFSERWEEIGKKINTADSVATQGLTNCEQEVVAIDGSHTYLRDNKKKFILFFCVAAVLIIACLAIVLPITLRKPQERFLSLADLSREDVVQTKFEEGVQGAGIEIIPLSGYEIDSYFLLFSDEQLVKGGGVEIYDEELESVTSLTFYLPDIKSEFSLKHNYKSWNVKKYSIKFLTEKNGELFKTEAIVLGSKVNYELVCFTADENIESVFTKLFGNA